MGSSRGRCGSLPSSEAEDEPGEISEEHWSAAADVIGAPLTCLAVSLPMAQSCSLSLAEHAVFDC